MNNNNSKYDIVMQLLNKTKKIKYDNILKYDLFFIMSYKKFSLIYNLKILFTHKYIYII